MLLPREKVCAIVYNSACEVVALPSDITLEDFEATPFNATELPRESQTALVLGIVRRAAKKGGTIRIGETDLANKQTFGDLVTFCYTHQPLF